MAEDQQPRIPGVKYRKARRERDETTVINGIPSTRKVPYDAWERVPPRDWDEVILRGVVTVTIGITVLAICATTGSIGGLLSRIIPAGLAYTVGVVFSLTWLSCMGVEWLQRTNTRAARVPQVASWIALGIGMAAVGTYGYVLDQRAAGAVGACVDLLSKGLITLVMSLYRVELDEGVEQWVADREQEVTARARLATRLRRLNSQAAYTRAVGGVEYDAADAMLAMVQQQQVTAPDPGPDGPSGQHPAASAPAAGSAPVAPAPAPAPAAAAPQHAPSMAVQPPTPAAPPSGQPSAPAVPPVPAPTGGTGEQQGGTPPVTPIGEGIAGTVRRYLAEHPETFGKEPLTPEQLLDMTDAVRQANGDRPTLTDTVRRTRDREVDRQLKARRSA
ncbi:hypothetical protein [Streptomyces sp. NRRL B-1347]|uniref:hypothetical protein n=1 Tax=Streptomyces sp. NRRL B-1347 TaxID=1476877 RepID=UPI00068CDF15|nr:hypothetical protein [Streptomyces sp. NRRL B-1347]